MTQYGCIIFIQILCHRTHLEEGVHVEQEYRSFDRRHFLEYGIQNGDWQGYANYINYTYFINYVYYTNYIAYTHYCRFVRILELRTTCGRRRERWLPNQLITWAISFVLLFVPDGFHTSVVCTHMMVRPMQALLSEKAPSSSKNESTPLLDATNIDHSWWIMQLACNLQWNPTEKATFCFGIMRIIEKIIAIIVT